LREQSAVTRVAQARAELRHRRVVSSASPTAAPSTSSESKA
jgi:hypothetical protein